MTIQRINALRDLDHSQLVNLAIQRRVIKDDWKAGIEWSADRLRLRLIDAICDEELKAQGKR